MDPASADIATTSGKEILQAIIDWELLQLRFPRRCRSGSPRLATDCAARAVARRGTRRFAPLHTACPCAATFLRTAGRTYRNRCGAEGGRPSTVRCNLIDQ